MLIRDTARADSACPTSAPTRAYPGHSARVAHLLCALDLAFRATATVHVRIEPTDQWARNRNRRPSAAMPVLLRLI